MNYKIIPSEYFKQQVRELRKVYPDFYDDEAKTGIDAVRNKCAGIGWRNGQWVITASASGKAEERRRLKIWQRQQGRQNDWESKRSIANKPPGTNGTYLRLNSKHEIRNPKQIQITKI